MYRGSAARALAGVVVMVVVIVIVVVDVLLFDRLLHLDFDARSGDRRRWRVRGGGGDWAVLALLLFDLLLREEEDDREPHAPRFGA